MNIGSDVSVSGDLSARNIYPPAVKKLKTAFSSLPSHITKGMRGRRPVSIGTFPTPAHQSTVAIIMMYFEVVSDNPIDTKIIAQIGSWNKHTLGITSISPRRQCVLLTHYLYRINENEAISVRLKPMTNGTSTNVTVHNARICLIYI
jgi:hypothetical protein